MGKALKVNRGGGRRVLTLDDVTFVSEVSNNGYSDSYTSYLVLPRGLMWADVEDIKICKAAFDMNGYELITIFNYPSSKELLGVRQRGSWSSMPIKQPVDTDTRICAGEYRRFSTPTIEQYYSVEIVLKD